MSGDALEQNFRQQLATQSSVSHWIIALSGGLDSMVLLELASRCLPAEQLTVLHVNHQLQAEADEWQVFCARQVERRGLRFIAESVSLKEGSVETAARHARYAVFERQLSPGAGVLLAHHGDDQAETLLFRLFRGAGVRGMAAMPRQRLLGRGIVFRPLLGVSRLQLAGWARKEGLSWVEDPSNADTQYDRNFLRQQVIPLLTKRWPGLSQRLQVTANHLADAEALLEELAQADLESCVADQTLMTAPLLQLSDRRQTNLLRYWCRQSGIQLTAMQLSSLRNLIAAGDDRQPELLSGRYIIRRYRGRLFVDPVVFFQAWEGFLSDALDTTVKHSAGRLMLEADGEADVLPWLKDVEIRNRQEGDKCHPLGRPAKSLKQLFQEAGVPPWQRDQWPVCVRGGSIVAVPGICLCESWCEGENKPPFWLDWQPAALFAGSDSGTL